METSRMPRACDFSLRQALVLIVLKLQYVRYSPGLVFSDAAVTVVIDAGHRVLISA